MHTRFNRVLNTYFRTDSAVSIKLAIHSSSLSSSCPSPFFAFFAFFALFFLAEAHNNRVVTTLLLVHAARGDTLCWATPAMRKRKEVDLSMLKSGATLAKEMSNLLGQQKQYTSCPLHVYGMVVTSLTVAVVHTFRNLVRANSFTMCNYILLSFKFISLLDSICNRKLIPLSFVELACVECVYVFKFEVVKYLSAMTPETVYLKDQTFIPDFIRIYSSANGSAVSFCNDESDSTSYMLRCKRKFDSSDFNIEAGESVQMIFPATGRFEITNPNIGLMKVLFIPFIINETVICNTYLRLLIFYFCI